MKSCDDGYPSCRMAEAMGQWCKGPCIAVHGAPAGVIDDEFAAECGYMLWKPYGDGCEGVGLLRMAGQNFRLQLFDRNAPFQNYCFHTIAAALCSFADWNPETMPDCPNGWVKHIETNRCRPGGDPEKESIGWPLPK